MPIYHCERATLSIVQGKEKGGQNRTVLSCEDCLFMDCLRANFQTEVWHRALEQYPKIPNPSGHGWTIEDEKPAIRWMTRLPASDAIIEFLSCKCTSVCKLPNCQCLVNGLKCTSHADCKTATIGMKRTIKCKIRKITQIMRDLTVIIIDHLVY